MAGATGAAATEGASAPRAVPAGLWFETFATQRICQYRLLRLRVLTIEPRRLRPLRPALSTPVPLAAGATAELPGTKAVEAAAAADATVVFALPAVPGPKLFPGTSSPVFCL